MTQLPTYRAVAGTNRPKFVGIEDGKPSAIESVALMFQLRRRARGKLLSQPTDIGRPKPRGLLKAELSADEEDIQLVVNFANQNDLWIDHIDTNKRLIHVHASARAVEKAFRIELTFLGHSLWS